MMTNLALSLGLAGVLALGAATPTMAAPISSNTPAAKAGSAQVTQVQWDGRAHRGYHRGYYRGYRGPAAAAAGIGFAAGALVGTAASIATLGAYDPYGAYAYDPDYYGQPTYYGPRARVGTTYDGSPIYANELGPNCTLFKAERDLC
jgi:hypothetical protein